MAKRSLTPQRIGSPTADWNLICIAAAHAFRQVSVHWANNSLDPGGSEATREIWLELM